MTKLDSADLTALTKAISDALWDHVREFVAREMEGQVRVEANRILMDIGEEQIRKMIREAVRARVDVEVRLRS